MRRLVLDGRLLLLIPELWCDCEDPVRDLFRLFVYLCDPVKDNPVRPSSVLKSPIVSLKSPLLIELSSSKLKKIK